jgi:8-oxo-dGTP pyrophosphatase MutT (NUDIX family)
MMAAEEYIRQAGTIPIRNGRLCLVTSRNGKRWIVPKGLIEPGQSAAEAALQEAWEEAGLVGRLDPDPVGSFLYGKYGGIYHVTLFILHVTEIVTEWPEAGLRERAWVRPAEALRRIDEPGLADVLRLALPPPRPVNAKQERVGTARERG